MVIHYLYLADNEQVAQSLRDAQLVQAKCGAGTKIMTRDQVARDYPFYQLDDVLLASHNRVNEGYYDGNTVFDWWRRSAVEHGVEYCQNEVVAIEKNAHGDKVQSVTLSTGESISCGYIVNASGPSANRTARMAGLDIPVEPRKRYTYVFQAEMPLGQDLPLTIDPSGVHMRSDGQHYLAGCPPDIDPGVDFDDFVADHSLWEDKVWPAIANRIPQFEAIRLTNSWVGHYAYNTLDQNAIIGPHTQVSNFIFMNGFSGHGFQQAPAMGRGLSELITYGEFRSLDLSPFSFERIALGQPFPERAVI